MFLNYVICITPFSESDLSRYSNCSTYERAPGNIINVNTSWNITGKSGKIPGESWNIKGFKQIFLFMQQKKGYVYLKNLKKLDSIKTY